MSRYLVIYENAGSNWSAYVPDLPGCVTTGANQQECKESIQDAIALYIEAASEVGKPIPEPSTRADYVNVARSA
ncbi:MAG: type II toxin-antitoxin system HicB family antitoxin [Fimbriimonadales bacterium]